MKTNVKRALSLFLALVLSCGLLLTPAGAASDDARAAANSLYQLGLFKGSGTLPDGSPNFDLDGTATRAQAAVMLVRLLGAEGEALSVHYPHPFNDADWAGDYIGYVYAKDITRGVSDTEFGTNSRITSAQFLTLLLRALGYSQVDWKTPYSAARAVGLAYSGVNNFCRGDMALSCSSALSCRVNGTSQTLRQQLEAKGVIQASSGFTPGPVVPAAAEQVTIYAGSEALDCIVAAFNARVSQLVITAPAALMQTCDDALARSLDMCPDLCGYTCGTYIEGSSMVMSVIPQYTDAAEIMAYLEGKRTSLSQENQQTLAEAKRVHASLANPSMSQYDQVKAFHDYLVNNITYQDTGRRGHIAAGALLDGRAVCDGYAAAFDLLCYFSGIDCMRVTGSAGGVGHAWNKVQVDGNWYNVDVTWDDPVSSRPQLRYDYFLISDSAISATHRVNQWGEWPAAPNNYTGR